jgi:uncharacterized OsmC-like protein
MSRVIVVRSARSRYGQDISIGRHRLHADEPQSAGGDDAGPDPYELLMAALGACTSMTVRIYAERRRWPLESVHICVRHKKVHADDCENCEGEERLLDRLELEVSFFGALTAEQRHRLMDVAGKCPVHRTLSAPVQIVSRESAEQPGETCPM